MKMFKSKKILIEDVPGGSAEERLQHYIRQQQLNEQRAADARGSERQRDRKQPPPPARRDEAPPLEHPVIVVEPGGPTPSDAIYLAPDPEEEHQQRTFRHKMFGIGWKGWVQLGVLSALVGVIVQTSGVNPFAPDLSLPGVAGALWRSTLTVLGWILTMGWQPLLVGAIAVAPVWLIWRLLTVPFRR